MKTHARNAKAKTAVPNSKTCARISARCDLFALLAFVTVLAASIGLSSCAGYTTNAAGQSTGNATAGTLSASSTTLSYGNVAVGSNSSLSLTVTNTGSATVDISQATISGAAFSVIGGNPSSTIPAGQSATVQIQFAPQSAGAVSGTFTIISNATNPTLAISLAATGVQPAFSLNPSALAFNNVTVGQSSSQNVTLTNTGNANLVVSSATVSGAGFAISGLALPKTLTAGQNVTFSVRFTPTSTTGVSGSVVFADNAPGTPHNLVLTGSAVAADGTLSATPGTVNFSNVVVGSNSQQTITLKNSGAGTVSINQVSTSGSGFSSSGFSAGQTIAAGGQATFTVTFTPVASGTASGTITITTNATNPTLSIPLSGTGTQGSLSANPSSINFGSVLVGNSGSVNVALTNTGTAPVAVSAASASGTGFSMGAFTAGTLNPNATTSFTVTFSPKAAGSATGSISVSTNAPGSPLKINLSGSGTATQSQLTISPSSVAFSNVSVGSNVSQTVTLTNTGNAALNITAATITGSGYTMTLAPMSINAGANTTFSVKFAPTAEGSAAGTISITSNAPGSPATIALSGTGLQALGSASPTSVAFGSVVVGNSNSSVITLKNTGNATLTFSQVSTTGTGLSVSGLTTSSTIAAGATLNFNAVFTPTTATTSSGSITLTTNGSPAQITISLAGAGTATTQLLSASPSTLSFGNVQVGSNSSQTTTITNNGNANVTISAVNVTGSGYTASGITSGLTLAPNQTATVTVTFTPTATGSASGSVSIVSNATNSPTAISLSGESHTVMLSWTPSSSSGVTGYYIYRKTGTGSYAKLNPTSADSGTQFTDPAVQAATSYSYEVTAVDSSGVESSPSTATTISVP
ncbi:MAG TPA: choice-of-anchor D domain-containing protein [Candidatus Dormibacteraeota bacterium]|nr:choice-of-anchor D domain-containing protein [Candidatus Dormibacteraeota bacterium]